MREAGGLSKLSPDQRAKVKLREVKAGDWCDDVPTESRKHLIEKGAVEVVEDEVFQAPWKPKRVKGGRDNG